MKKVTTNIQDATPVIASKQITGTPTGSTAKVYFTKHIDAEHLIQLYNLVNNEIFGKVAIKIHTGEQHGPYILPRDMVKAFQAQVPDSSIVETNTLYDGDRFTTDVHKKTLEINGWTFCDVDILDQDGTVDLPVRGGKQLKEVAMGGHIVNYDSLIVLTHFKGHPMGGFGGSMKNIAIGIASGHKGKAQVHGTPLNEVPPKDWPSGEPFIERMVESAKATCDFFGKKITFLNVMRCMSVDCDCMGLAAAKPTISDIGIAVSTDILAVDQACVDMVYHLGQKENHDLVERMESRHGLRQLSYMSELKMGNPQYELISIDE